MLHDDEDATRKDLTRLAESGRLWAWSAADGARTVLILADDEDEAYEKAIAERMKVSGEDRANEEGWFEHHDELFQLTEIL